MSRWLLCEAMSVLICQVAFSGCGGMPAGPETIEVTGTVTYQGTPVEGANVTFHPTSGSEQTLASQGVTDNEGRFALSTHVGGGKFKPGIVPGQYGVAITKLDTAGISTTLGPPKDLLPRKYGSPTTSQLTADVAAGTPNNFEFPLSDK